MRLYTSGAFVNLQCIYIPVFFSQLYTCLLFVGRHEETTSDEITAVDEDSYFSSYSHYSIHEEMLKVTIILALVKPG